MYSLLNMDWDSILDSDLSFKSFSRVRTLEINGKEVEDSYSDDSMIIIVYNIFTAIPIISVERLNGFVDIDENDERFNSIPPEFTLRIDHVKLEDKEYTDIILVRKELYNSLVNCEEPI